ncbi:MAG: HEPN domain-containing protein [Moorellaceae bacterium]
MTLEKNTCYNYNKTKRGVDNYLENFSIFLFDWEEFTRWWRQAEHTLASAERDKAAGDFAWASFKAQQAAEYSVKALIRGIGRISVGHSTLKLLSDLTEAGFKISEEILTAARAVDRHYIPPRYPDAYAGGSPFEFYDVATAESAIAAARKIINFIREVIDSASASRGGREETQ